MGKRRSSRTRLWTFLHLHFAWFPKGRRTAERFGVSLRNTRGGKKVFSSPFRVVTPLRSMERSQQANGSMPNRSCGWRIVISPIVPQDPKLNVTLLHCAQNLPQDQFARDRFRPEVLASRLYESSAAGHSVRAEHPAHGEETSLIPSRLPCPLAS